MKTTNGLVVNIVGNIGSGKTSLGRLLAEKNKWLFLEEDLSFIDKLFGEKGEKTSQLEVSLGFLDLRINQNKSAVEAKEMGNIVVVDTVYEMTDLISKDRLNEFEYKEFLKEYENNSVEIEEPDLIIHLEGDTNIFLERALKRNMNEGLQSKINKEEMELIDSKIRSLLEKFDKDKILSYDSSKIDIRSDEFVVEISKIILEFQLHPNA